MRVHRRGEGMQVRIDRGHASRAAPQPSRRAAGSSNGLQRAVESRRARWLCFSERRLPAQRFDCARRADSSERPGGVTAHHRMRIVREAFDQRRRRPTGRVRCRARRPRCAANRRAAPAHRGVAIAPLERRRCAAQAARRAAAAPHRDRAPPSAKQPASRARVGGQTIWQISHPKPNRRQRAHRARDRVGALRQIRDAAVASIV